MAFFLDAPSHLYKRSCPSVRPSVRRSVRPALFSKVKGKDTRRIFLFLCPMLSPSFSFLSFTLRGFEGFRDGHRKSHLSSRNSSRKSSLTSVMPFARWARRGRKVTELLGPRRCSTRWKRWLTAMVFPSLSTP